MKVKLKISRRDLAVKNYRDGANKEIVDETHSHPDQSKLIAEALYKILFMKEGTKMPVKNSGELTQMPRTSPQSALISTTAIINGKAVS